MAIYVKNEKKDGDKSFPGRMVYIGRPSILGNPYSHLSNTLAEFKVKNRKEAIDKYKEMFYNRILYDVEFRTAIDSIVKDAFIGHNIYLFCWCKPFACHGDIIKEYIESKLRNK